MGQAKNGGRSVLQWKRESCDIEKGRAGNVAVARVFCNKTERRATERQGEGAKLAAEGVSNGRVTRDGEKERAGKVPATSVVSNRHEGRVT